MMFLESDLKVAGIHFHICLRCYTQFFVNFTGKQKILGGCKEFSCKENYKID